MSKEKPPASTEKPELFFRNPRPEHPSNMDNSERKPEEIEFYDGFKNREAARGGEEFEPIGDFLQK
jgi:hypothetical protein